MLSVLMSWYAVWYVREKHDISVSCMPTYGKKYLAARYTWRDHLQHGAARSDFVLLGNGTMLIHSAELTDSDTYRCYVDLPDDKSEVFTHSIIGKLSPSHFPRFSDVSSSFPFSPPITACRLLQSFILGSLNFFDISFPLLPELLIFMCNLLFSYFYPVSDISGDGVLFSIDLNLSFFVSLLARLRENGWTDLHEIFREGVE